jgi:hypothetical protein
MGPSFQVTRADCSPYDRIAPARERFYWSSAVAGDIAGPVGNARTARLDRASRGFARGIPAHAKPLRQDGLLHLRLHLHLRRREGRGQARDHAPRRSVRSPPAREVPRNSRIRVRSGMSAARTHPGRAKTRAAATRADAIPLARSRRRARTRSNRALSRGTRASRPRRRRVRVRTTAAWIHRGKGRETKLRRFFSSRTSPSPSPSPSPSSPPRSSPLQRGRRQG